MGQTFDALFGRRSSKLRALLRDSISRTTYLKNRQESLLTFTSSDVFELLKLGHTKQALLRVEHVIKSKNMLDTLAMIESYCHLLTPRVSQIEKNREFPEEMKEAISSLVFASSRIGEFPELQHIRDYFSSKFGKDYVSQCIDFPLYSSVNGEIVQKLSTRKPGLETRVGFLREIASKNGITLHLDTDIHQGEDKGKATKLSRNTLTINQALKGGG